METNISVYNEFRGQLDDLKRLNDSVLFDYDSPQGNKEARSHIYKLRQTKRAVDKARKEEKAASLEYGRQVDAQAKAIISEIEAMISIHQSPLDRIEQKEKDRIAAHQKRIEEMRELSADTNEDISSDILIAKKAQLDSYKLGEHWDEYEVVAARVKESGLTSLNAQIKRQKKLEAEREELAQLRKKQEQIEREHREAEIARKAEERARAEAEEKANAERQAAERREQELRMAAERAERERAEAELRADRAAEQAKKQAEIEAHAKAAREAEESRQREANKRHKQSVDKKARDALIKAGIDKAAAELAINCIASGDVPNVRIEY